MAVDAKLRHDFLSKGWVISNRIGGGGGGDVYLAYPKTFIDSIIQAAAAAPVVGRSQEEQLEYVLGAVSRAHDVLLKGGEWAAVLKIARSDPARTTREIDAMRKCIHPHLTRLVDADPSDRPSWFVMKFHPKGDLSVHQASFAGRRLDVLRKIRPVVDAVAVMHRDDLIHRDIKASNIFVSDSSEWVLGDFGIAYEKAGERLTEPDQSLWSKDWRADWVAGRKPEDFKPTVDVFGLAKVIHYMITGLKVPASQIDEPHADIRRLHPGAPGVQEVYDLLVGHVVGKESQLQSKSATEFAARIDAVLRDTSGDTETLVFSFVSADAPTHVDDRLMDTFHNLAIKLPHDTGRLELMIRLAGTGSPSGILTLRDMDGVKMAKRDLELFNTSPVAGYGRWSSPVLFPFKNRIPAGWYLLSIDLKLGAGSITGLTITAR